MTFENLLTSGFHFSEDESLLKYRYKLMNSMFLVGIFIATLASIIRFSVGNTVVAATDLTMVLVFVTGFVYLRTNKSVFGLVTTLQLSFSFILFSIVILVLPENQIKLLWYALLIIVSYMLKGIKGGLLVYAASIIALTLFYSIPQVIPQTRSWINLNLSFPEVIMAMLAYSTIALYNAFAVLQQQKSLDNLRKANKKIKKQQQQLYKQLRSFPTTKLPNSLALNEKLAECTPGSTALVTLAIDDYIILADEFGATYAHKIVHKTAALLQQFTNDYISLYHVAPYQFSFLLENNSNGQEMTFTKNIKNHFEHIHINIEEIEISISFSIGIAKEEIKNLITHANTALHEAQSIGVNNYKLFTEDKQRAEEQKNNIYWNSKIKEIIHQNKLHLYYQPIIDNKTQKTGKYECLIRAMDQDKIISPYLFLQAAKTRGMLPTITRFVIDKSFRKFSGNTLEFSINITEDDLRSNYLVSFLGSKCEQYNISPQRVYLEVLENISTAQTSEIQTQFETLKEMGFGIAIDDFGAEASNLSRLLTYQADIIKIDGIFIKNLDTDSNSIKIVETIVSLAQKLGAQTVAEFVHNETIYNIVKELGVDYSQGYFFSPPLPDIIQEEELLTA